jgi:O-antigen/teichoic acid export membrane protein
VSDVPGAVLQTNGHITTDNLFQTASELTWAAGSAVFVMTGGGLGAVGLAFVAANMVLLMLRGVAAHTVLGAVSFHAARRHLMLPLLGFGAVTVAAQLADFLYAPVDYVLINRLLGAVDVATYAPAVQIDSGLLLLVAALATVLLPQAALAHAADDAASVRRYYVRGTLASAALLAAGAAVVWVLAPWLLRLWLGNPMPDTQAILPLVLIHTVLGGSSAVGRSILLGMGKVKPFAIAALVAGVANVILSFCFVKYLNLGLRGIIYGTIVVVTVRCAIWMPWYVLRSIRHGDAQTIFDAEAPGPMPA